MPAVSVIVPVKNGAEYVAEALRSVLLQDLADIEVIVVDDGSLDDSAAIAKSLGNHDDRLKIVANSGAGIVDALNMGISLAQAPLVARMDCDDVCLPDRLRLQVERFDADPDLQLLGTAGISIDRTGQLLGAIEVPCDDQQIRDALLTYNPVLHPTAMFRTETARRVGGYRRAFIYAEDYDLWIRLSELGRLANMEAKLVKLRRHPTQTSTTKRDQQKAAGALARQSAIFRRVRVEPFDANSQPDQAIKLFLACLADEGRGIGGDQRRDIELLLRTPGISSALMRRILVLAAFGAPSLGSLALGPRLAWHRMATQLSARSTAVSKARLP